MNNSETKRCFQGWYMYSKMEFVFWEWRCDFTSVIWILSDLPNWEKLSLTLVQLRPVWFISRLIPPHEPFDWLLLSSPWQLSLLNLKVAYSSFLSSPKFPCIPRVIFHLKNHNLNIVWLYYIWFKVTINYKLPNNLM